MVPRRRGALAQSRPAPGRPPGGLAMGRREPKSLPPPSGRSIASLMDVDIMRGSGCGYYNIIIITFIIVIIITPEITTTKIHRKTPLKIREGF